MQNFHTNTFLTGIKVCMMGLIFSLATYSGEDKSLTLINASSTADGKSQIRTDILEECIMSLPKPEALEAEVASSTLFLKEIGGKKGKNAHTKVYTASIEINYMVYQKKMIIVTTASVQGQAPVIKEVEGKIRQSKRFDSDSGSGDIYGGQSHRAYYFSSADKAAADVKKRAATWLKQQSAVVCSSK